MKTGFLGRVPKTLKIHINFIWSVFISSWINTGYITALKNIIKCFKKTDKIANQIDNSELRNNILKYYGSRIKLTGEGEHGPNGGTSGDLYILLSVNDHSLFERDGADIFCEVPEPTPQTFFA